jgi:phosphoglycerol transferase
MIGKKLRAKGAADDPELGAETLSKVPLSPTGISHFFRGKFIKSLLATIIFMVVLFSTANAWKLDLYSPITYWGDALEMSSYLGRDYVFNDLRERFFAPFGVEHASPLRYVVNLLFQPNSTLFLIAYSVTRDTVASLNLYYLLTFPLAFVSAYWVFGRLKLPDPFRFGSATLYALMPFHFQRGVGHLMESSYFLAPLLIYVVLLTFTARPYFHAYVDGAWRLSWKDKRDWFFLCVMVFLSPLNEYHQLFFMMLLTIAALVASMRYRNHRILAGAAILLAAAGLSTVAKMLLSGLLSEPGLGLSLIGRPISSYGDAERYGLKMIQVVLPVMGHHLESFRDIRGIYDGAHEVNENSTVALGLFGAVGFVYLIAHGVYAIIRKTPKGGILDLCSLLTLCCVLIATIGGVASVVATAGAVLFGSDSLLTQVRGYNRIIVFIAFFSYYACSVLLMRLAFRASAHAPGRLSKKAVAAIVWLPIFALALWDQVPFQLTNSKDGAARYSSDRDFFPRIEAQLAPRSLIFQYPFNLHHADVNRSGRYPYNYSDGIRPYLNSQTLRFTYGGDSGSVQITWLEQTSALPPQRLIQRLCEYGFSGMVVHRKLFKAPERESAEFEALLSAALGSSLQESTDKDFSFAPLDGFCARSQIAKLDLAAERIRLSEGGKPADGKQIRGAVPWANPAEAPAAGASLPLAPAWAAAAKSDSDAKCFTDAMNGAGRDTAHIAKKMRRSDILEMRGWAFDAKAGSHQAETLLELANADRSAAYYFRATRGTRRDVSTHPEFAHLKLENPGITILADLGGMRPGQYATRYVMRRGEGGLACASWGKSWMVEVVEE